MFNAFVAGANLTVAIICFSQHNVLLGSINLILFLLNSYAADDLRS